MTLQHVDTAIAFAVIMLGASLLITVVTQGVSTLLSLRGNNLQRSLSDLLETLYPEQKDQADAIARSVLKHPLLSDSSFGSNAPLHKNEAYRLPAAVGAAAVAGVAIGALFDAPQWVIGTGVLAAVVFGMGIYWASKDWELASAVRVEEFFGMLEKIAKSEPESPVAKAMREITRKLGGSDDFNARLEELRELADKCREGLASAAGTLRSNTQDPAVTKVLDLMLSNIGASDHRKVLAGRVRAMVTDDLHATADLLHELATAEHIIEADKASVLVKMRETAENGLKEVAILFNAAMDRTSQRFALHSRVVTVVFSLVFALVAHFDAIKLFKQLSEDADLRANLVASSDAMMKQADKILSSATPAAQAATRPAAAPPATDAAVPPTASAAPPAANSGGGASPPTPSAVAVTTDRVVAPALPAAPSLQPTARELDKATVDCLAADSLRAVVPSIYAAAMICPTTLIPFADARAAARRSSATQEDKDAWIAEKRKMRGLATREDALDYVKARVRSATTKEDELEQQVDRYLENLNTLLSRSESNQLFDQAASINGQLARAGIDLWPDPYPGFPKPQEFPGLLVAAALLSLGAPFWFNMLKTLSNLRPLVATREEKDREAKAKAEQTPG